MEIRSGNKENACVEPSKQLQKLRIQLNDRIFEIRKLEQDQAQEKAKLFIELQREKQHFNRTLKELKEKNVMDNEEWTKKIDQLRQEHEQTLATNLEHFVKQIKREKEQVKAEVQPPFKHQIKQLQTKLKDAQEELVKQQQEWKREKSAIIEKMKKEFTEKEKDYTIKQAAIAENIRFDHQMRVSSLQNIYLQEQAIAQKLQKELDISTRQHVREKIQWESCTRAHKEKHEQLSADIASLQHVIHNLKEQIVFIKRQNDEKVRKMHHEHQIQLKKQKEEAAKQQQERSKTANQQLQMFRTQIDKLEEIHRGKESIWEERGRRMLELYERRQSKKQDIRAIESLEVQLMKRQLQLQRQRRELKHCQLQLQNMQQIYDKIFVSNGYLSKAKSKSFKIKKLKTSNNPNQSNLSTIVDIKRHALEERPI